MKILPMFIDEKIVELINLRGGEDYLKAILTKAVFDDSPNLYEAHELGFKDDDFKDFNEWERPLYDEAQKYLNKRYQKQYTNAIKAFLNRR